MGGYNYAKKDKDKAKEEKETAAQNPKIIDDKIKSGKLGGIYCFFGDEEYMIDYYIKKIMDGSGADGFDSAVFDADNFDLDLFRDIIASYPVISDYKIAVVKNAGEIKFKSGEKDEFVRFLSEYKNDIREYCCLIFKLKTLTEPKAKTPAAAAAQALPKKPKESLSLTAFLKENAELFEFKENPPASLIKWLKKIAASENVELSDENAGYILNRTEMKMYPLKNELDKLVRYAKSGGRNIISRGDIELLVTVKTEMEAFELTNAILDKKYGKAVASLEKLQNLKEEPVVILGQIARHFGDLLAVDAAAAGATDSYAVAKKTGIHEYKVRLVLNSLKKYKNPAGFIYKSLDLCRECDVKLKSTALPEYALIENLLIEIAGL